MKVKIYFKVYQWSILDFWLVAGNDIYFNRLSYRLTKEKVKRDNQGKLIKTEIPIIQGFFEDIENHFSNKKEYFDFGYLEENVFDTIYYHVYEFETTERKLKNRLIKHNFVKRNSSNNSRDFFEIVTKLESEYKRIKELQDKEYEELQQRIKNTSEGDIEW